MITIETETKLADIFLALSEGEKSIDINRQILVELDDFDPYQIFIFFDNEQKNHINTSDLQLFLQERGIFANEIELKLIILFYDSDYDGVLSYPEFSNFLQSEFSKKKVISNNPQEQNINPNLSNNIDQALRQLLGNEVELAKNILFLLNELKMRYDFNLHDLYHSVKNWNYIEENSLRNFLGRNKISYLESDIRKIMKRLDFNGDGKIDLCEFHAFLGFPECQYCCPLDTCNSCGICCCNLCISDVPCPIHNCIHRNINKPNNNLENSIKNNLNFQNENNDKNLNLNNMQIQNEDQNKINIINPIPVPKTMKQRSKTPSINYNFENNDPNREQGLYKDKNINNIQNNSKINKNYKNNLNFNNSTNMDSNPDDIENFNFNYSNGIRDSERSNSFLGRVSDNLVLRASPQRKYSPKVFNCNTYCSDLTRKTDYICNVVYNPEPCEKCIHNHCDFCHEEIYPINNDNFCNNYTACQICHNIPCCCCSSCNCYPCRCKCCPICRSIECKCCPKCHTFPCKCCPVCHSLECKCCPNCKKFPCKCCQVCHLEECRCCKLCHKYPCICCPKCHFPNCRCCSVCKNYPCVCCPVCHMAKCICCENCKNYPCRCCPDCHCVNCQCCIQCGCYPCRCSDTRYNCCQMCGNMPCQMPCQTCKSSPCICCPYCHFNPCKCPGCTCEKQCIAMNLNAMNCPIHNIHSMKHNEGCPYSPKCPHIMPKCAHPKKKDNNQNNSNSNNSDFNNNSSNNQNNNQNNNSNNNPNNNFNNNHPIHNHPFNHFSPHNHQHFPPNPQNRNKSNNSLTYSYNESGNNYPYNNGQDSDDDFNNQSNNNDPNYNRNPNNNNGPNNNQYNGPNTNQYNRPNNKQFNGPNDNQYNESNDNQYNGPNNNESDNDYNNNFPNNENNDNNNFPNNSNIPYDNNNQNPNENQNQGNPNKNCPLSPVSSAFPPNSPFFNAEEPGQKSNWIFCPKCNVYHRCPHPGCEHNPNKRTTTHKCIHDEDNQEQEQNPNNSSQNINNQNQIQNNPQNNLNISNNGPNMSTPNFNNNNFISFNPNNMNSSHGRINQSQSSKNKPQRKRGVFSSCPYQEELGQFVDFLGFLMEVESKIEDMKIELARRDDFNFEDIFRIFEVDGKGYIEPEDLKQGLKLLGLNPSDFDIKLLLKRFDLNQQGLLTYSDFFDMVVSFEKKLRNSVQIRPPNSCCPCKSPDVFECDTLIAIKNLFKFIIECEREINQMRSNFDSLRSKYSDVVQFLDYSRRGVINRSDLKLYLTQFNKFTTSKECDLLFIRLDKTRSGEVGIDEIENELMFIR